MANHPSENPQPEHAWKPHCVQGVGTLAKPRQWVPNPHFESPYWHCEVHGTNKLVEPFAVITTNNKYLPPPSSHTTTGCLCGFIVLHFL